MMENKDYEPPEGLAKTRELFFEKLHQKFVGFKENAEVQDKLDNYAKPNGLDRSNAIRLLLRKILAGEPQT